MMVSLSRYKFAVVLSGCGVFDGTEIHEAVLVLLAICRHGGTYQCFAPDVMQIHVINHITGEVMPEKRNVLVESARIARGEIKDLSEYNPSEYDGLIFPGGFGAAKNLSTVALDGENAKVNILVEQAIENTRRAGKPIGALCIAPTIVAKILGKVDVTIGNNPHFSSMIEKMGARHVDSNFGEVCIDSRSRIVTTPCYMLESTIDQIATGAENTVKAMLTFLTRKD